MMRNYQHLAKILIFILLSVIIGPFTAFAATIDDSLLIEQRKQYVAAKKSLNAGRITDFKKRMAGLKDYPLYPYLRYDYLSRRLWKVKSAEIIDFLKHYDDLPKANDLRKSWLKLLAKRKNWTIYADNYTPQSDKTLQCYQLSARIKTKNDAYLLEDIRTTWLAGESLPPQCDQAFALLYKSELMTDELVWQRIRLAMENKQTSLATFLSRKLGKEKANWAARWLAMHQNPSKGTHKVKLEDVPIAREILLYGMHRLTRQNIDRALSRWNELKPAYSFSTDEINKLERALSTRAVIKKHKRAKQLLNNIATAEVDERILHLRLRTALKDKDWDAILKWTADEPDDDEIRLRWYYWRARAFEETGKITEANKIFEWLSKERDYYGFLAADKISAPYQMNYRPLPEDRQEWQRLSEMPAVKRSRELYLLGSHYSARREWHHSLTLLTSYQTQIAASIAANWGWHDRAIITLAKAKIYDDLVTRFPLPFNKTIVQFANMRNLDIGWVYALIRAESAFIEDVGSPAGALGLMQVMPATGKATAKSIGLRKYDTKKLLQSSTNVRIGSAYLKQMYESFNSNAVLATAAYNAGPTNVRRWLPKSDCEQADIWIEQIPFTETRKYVRRILYFASVYDWRLKREIVPIQQRVSPVQPHKQIVARKSFP
jgi:soluble lytic murein transglycosylase